jgi:hypothetical protein
MGTGVGGERGRATDTEADEGADGGGREGGGRDGGGRDGGGGGIGDDADTEKAEEEW